MLALVRSLRPSPIEWLCLVLGCLLTVRYAWVMDDAFIYFRYADNALYLGYGLVYNAGEYVEGYSSPFWMLLMLALRATELNYSILIRAAGVLTYAAFWAVLVASNRRLSPKDSRGGAYALNLPLCYLTANYGVLCYFTSGLETPLVQLSAALFALFFLVPGSRALQLALALTPVVRHELVLPLAVAWLFLWIRTRRFPLWLGCWSAGLTGAWLLFRVLYYADLFPNTFYLKENVNISQGLIYVHDTARTYLAYLLAPAALGVFLWLRKRTGGAGGHGGLDGPARLGMLLGAGTLLVYVIKLGGDARHFRFMAFPFCLAAAAAGGLAEHARAELSRARTAWARRLGTRAAGTVLALLLLLATASSYPGQLDRHPLLGGRFATYYHGITDAQLHRDLPDTRIDPWGWGRDLDQLYPEFVESGARYTRVHSNGLCVAAYVMFRERCVHSWGLTDAVLARVDVPMRRPSHRPRLPSFAGDIVEVYAKAGPPERGMYRRAVERGIAAGWIADNLPAIETIERKIFNRHDLRENLGLAFTFPGRLRVPAKEDRAPARAAEAPPPE